MTHTFVNYRDHLSPSFVSTYTKSNNTNVGVFEVVSSIWMNGI